MRQAVERWLAGAHGRLRRSPPIQGEVGAPPAGRTGPFPRSASDTQRRSDDRVRRLAPYDEVRRGHAEGEPPLPIARAMDPARGTVRNYARAESVPERAARRAGRDIIDPHLPYLRTRVAEGREDAAAPWREPRARGFAGTAEQVRRWPGERRRKPAKTAPRRWRGRAPADPGRSGESAPAPSPASRQLAWPLVQPAATPTPADAAAVARVERDEGAAAVAGLARRSTALVRGCNAANRADVVAARAGLDAWLTEAGACGVPAMETFAAGLGRDGDAVRAALTTPWRNGRTEGQVNRLKLLKRQSHGRAGFDLLRRRVLLAA